MTSPRGTGPIGVAVVGAGKIGRLRGRLAAQHPGVRFLAVGVPVTDALAELRAAEVVCTSLPDTRRHVPSTSTKAPPT